MAVVGKTADEINARASFLEEMLHIQIAAGARRGVALIYHPRMPGILAEVYFAISEAYKIKHLPPGNRTDAPKRAALTCAAIALVDPLRPARPDEPIEQEEYIYVNQMFAMRTACAIVHHEFSKRPFDDRRRIYKSLQNLDFPSVQPILDEAVANNGIITTEWKIELTADEIITLNLLVDKFSLYQQLGAPDQSFR